MIKLGDNDSGQIIEGVTMGRLIQIIQNLFIRLEAYFSVVFKSFLSFIGAIFGFFVKLLGFTSSNYYVESDAAETIQGGSDQKPVQLEQNKTSETPTNTRLRPQAKVDNYYLNMARDVRKN